MKAIREMDVIEPIRNLAYSSDTGNDKISIETVGEYICNIQALAFAILQSILENQPSVLAGNLIENLVLSECYMRYRESSEITVGYAKYKYDKSEHEIDTVIKKFEDFSPRYILIEVKYSDKPHKDFGKHLNDSSISSVLPGKIDKKYIVYRGETQRVYGFQYVNIFDFLTNLDNWLY
jgi:predicted AAA+ superfamily ATPase